jgi:hypothetical protein
VPPARRPLHLQSLERLLPVRGLLKREARAGCFTAARSVPLRRCRRSG